MKAYKDFKTDTIHTFNCECGSPEFHRPDNMTDLRSFYQGVFFCSNCGASHDHNSDAFYKRPVQIKMFE